MIPTLKHLDPEQFLAEYWHKKPLLIRQAFPNFESPLDPDELAGMACEEGIESRLIIEQPTDHYQLECGPFAEERFSSLPESHWTLLVQAVDHWIPEVAELMAQFRFVPDWRIDDIMISYAADGGSVGPHFDNYDVFLIQGMGKRRWKIGPACPPDAPLADHSQLKILNEFEQSDEWVLEPGDMLYLPPRFAHWGVAEGDDCMTYSVGFRAPSEGDLIGNWCDEVLSTLSDHQRYADADLAPQTNPAEITPAAVDRVRTILQKRLLESDDLERWLGAFLTEKKYTSDLSDADQWDLQALQQLAEADAALFRASDSKLAFSTTENGMLLFADGESFSIPQGFEQAISQLCQEWQLPAHTWCEWLADNEMATLLLELLNQGTLEHDDQD